MNYCEVAPSADNTNRDPLVGLCVDGKYQLDALVGSGGMGTVYQAQQINLRRTVALKVFKRDAVQQPTQLELLKREALAVARLRHRNIISIFDFGISPGIGAYLLLEFLEGKSIKANRKADENRQSPRTGVRVPEDGCLAPSV